MSKYEWKIKSLAKGIDATLALQELERIEAVYGSLSPENILKESEGGDSILHHLFEWDDNKAANSYRLQQARTIINNISVKTIRDGQSFLIPVYEIVTIGDDRKYKSIETMDRSDVDQVRKATLKDLASIKAKLQVYDEFERTKEYIQNAINTL